MAKKPANTVRQEYIIPASRPEVMVVVTRAQWGVIMDRISRCKDDSQFYQSLGWGLIGFGSSSFISAVTFPCSVNLREQTFAFWAELAIGIAAGVGLLAGYISLRFSGTHKKDRLDLLGIIQEDMQIIADRGENSEA